MKRCFSDAGIAEDDIPSLVLGFLSPNAKAILKRSQKTPPVRILTESVISDSIKKKLENKSGKNIVFTTQEKQMVAREMKGKSTKDQRRLLTDFKQYPRFKNLKMRNIRYWIKAEGSLHRVKVRKGKNKR